MLDTRLIYHPPLHYRQPNGGSMLRLALICFHSCPVGRLGEKDTGGMNVYVRQLARRLGKQGYQVDIFTRRHDPEDPQIVPIGKRARVIHIKAGPLAIVKEDLYQHIPEFIYELGAFQQSECARYDLIHSHYWLSGRIGMKLSRRWRIPHIATFHTHARTKLKASPAAREVERRACVEEVVMDSVDAIVASTVVERDEITELYGAAHSKIKVVPPGVDLDLFKPSDKTQARRALNIAADARVVLFVGRMERLKGIDILLRAANLLNTRANTRLLIVGGGQEDDAELLRLKALAAQLRIQDMVTFTGAVEQERLPAYYNAADVMAMPSYYESFGLAALEAMACATPVVVSKVGGLQTFIEHGSAGYLIPRQCPEPFAHAIDTLLADPALANAMGNAARRKASKMSWDRTAKAMLKCYQPLLNRERAFEGVPTA